MTRICLILAFITLSFFSYSQDSLTVKDSSAATTLSVEKNEPLIRQRTNAQNYDYILEVQRQNQARKKKQAWLYMGMGVLFLAVLVVGVVRRRKRK